MPLQIRSDSNSMSRREGRNISKELSQAGRSVKEYSSIAPEDLKKDFENSSTSTAKRQYAQAYMMRKYGENVKYFAELSAPYAEVYGLDESSNPYLNFLKYAKDNKLEFKRESPKVSKIFFEMVESDDPLIDDETFINAIKLVNMKSDDDNAFYIQTIRFILDKDEMKKWRPDDPTLEAPEVQEARTKILSGKIDNKDDLVNLLNTEIATTTNRASNDESRVQRRRTDYSEREIRQNFARLPQEDRQNFRRMAGQVGIDLTQFGIENA